MNFTTKIPVGKSKFPIDYTSKIVSLGSCFAENMGDKFSYFKFQNSVNPFGIIFNPVSIENLLSRIVNKQQFTEKDIFFHNDLWHCFEVHSELSNSNKEELLQILNRIIEQSNNQLLEASHIIITYGTAWIYRNNESDKIVANCHKVPQKQFSKEILSVEKCVVAMQNTLDLIQKINPNCKFIFTVSPVRHIKDGFVENQLSKSHLITAIHKIVQTERFKLMNEYFPSYEIVMDELRDYRFYGEDMLHPNQLAIDYIWERFSQTNISEDSSGIINEVAMIQKDLNHRPFNANTEKHQQFLSKLEIKIKKIQAQFPFMDF